MKILAVCGMGLGSGLLLRMQAEKALRQLGKSSDVDVEVTDIGTARAMAATADLIITSEELAEQLGPVKPRVITISNFIDLGEMVTKLGAAMADS